PADAREGQAGRSGSVQVGVRDADDVAEIRVVGDELGGLAAALPLALPLLGLLALLPFLRVLPIPALAALLLLRSLLGRGLGLGRRGGLGRFGLRVLRFLGRGAHSPG